MKDKPITFGSLTRTAYLFSSALFSLANILRISPLEKNTPTLYSRVWEWRNSRDVLDGKKIKITNACKERGGERRKKEREREREREKIRDNGPQLLFANFHQRGGDCVRSLFAARPNAK